MPGAMPTTAAPAATLPVSGPGEAGHGAADEPTGRAAAALNATLSAASHARADSVHTTGKHRQGPGRHDLHRSRRSRRGRAKPALAGALAVGLLGSGVAYARTAHLASADATPVVGSGVIAETGDLARAASVDLTYRAAASVSRNERRTAIAAAGARDAAELEAQQKAAAAKAAAVAKAEAAKVAAEKAKQKVIADAKKDPQAAAKLLMVDQGWTSDTQYRCLVNLWNGESDWRWYAENASSSAYGIPQSLPAGKMAQFGDDYRTNPVTQIKWGLWYIKMSYGNPCNAWSTWQARSPHWY
ncbi:MAG: hypothetical protein JWP82_2417 [Humibacillus sp.]|nr:hypothetical protein [Humibacillus sp.]